MHACLLLFLKFPEKGSQAFLLCIRKIIFLTKIQIIAQPFYEKPESEATVIAFRKYLDEMNTPQLSNSIERKFDRAKKGIERIMKIVNSLKRFSRVDMDITGKLDVNQAINDAIEVLSNQVGEDVEFVLEPREVPPIQCVPAEINQCLLHVLKNALDAIGSKGIVKISFREDEGEIELQIEDNGKGMSPEVLQQAFNPFFTTKPVGSGTGVGLSLTERLIKRHGGTIKILSNEGEGTTVTIRIPISCEEVQAF